MLVRDTEKRQKDKLLTRTARLLHWAIEKDMGETRKELDLAYIVRSVHVHGGKLTAEQKEFAKTQTNKILNYSRLIVSIILQLYPEVDKEGLIDRIETSQKDEQRLKEFKNELQKLAISP